MSKILNVVLALSLTAFAFTAQAEQGKIAVLSWQEAVINTEVAKTRLKALQEDKDFVATKNEFEKLRGDLQKKFESFKKEAAVMNAAQKAEQQKKLQTGQADLEHLAKKLKASETDVVQRLMGEMQPKLQKVVAELIKSDGIGMILDKQAVMHVDTSFNITGKVTEKLNQAN